MDKPEQIAGCKNCGARTEEAHYLSCISKRLAVLERRVRKLHPDMTPERLRDIAHELLKIGYPATSAELNQWADWIEKGGE